MTNTFDTPILLLIFNRLDVTQKVFDQIKKLRPSYLFVAADGPRVNHASDILDCNQTRAVINQIDWPCELKTLFRDENLGCGLAVSSAIGWFFEQVEEGIILEDDCLPDLSFFQFCSELLVKYRDDESIYLVSGANLQNGNLRGDASYYFSNYPITWGWASWRRAWKHFNYEVLILDQTFKSGLLDHVFQNSREKLYWRNKFRETELKRKNIWDYQWFYAIWKNKGVGITPNFNLITNLGFRNNSIHNFLRDSLREPTTTNSIQFPLIHPQKKIDRVADQYTFTNAFSHSFIRLHRLTKENGLPAILRYAISKFR